MVRPRIHHVEERFFDKIDSEEKAYWLGFLYADGCPTKRAVMLGLSAKDADHVTAFRDTLGSTQNIRTTDRVSSCAMSSVYLAKRFADLRDGAVIPKFGTNHFVRGVFDGDGCVCETNRGYFTVTIAGREKLIRKIACSLTISGIPSIYVLKHHKPNTPTYVLFITTRRGICLFRDFMYDEATTYLSRKKEILDRAFVLPDRICPVCDDAFTPRYQNKGIYCSRKCYLKVYYREHPEKWHNPDGSWH